jgi:hypothetical protein
MTSVRRLLCAAALGVAVSVTAGCGHAGTGSTTFTHAPPPPRTIQGTVRSFLSASKARLLPMARVRVTVYRKAFVLGGPVRAGGPPPVAVTTTTRDGTFSFRVLPAGRYFVVADYTAQWVTLPQGHGTVADFRVCADCPRPM